MLKMNLALTIFPCFTDKSIPLGLACINAAVKLDGHETLVFDFDWQLSIENRNLYRFIYDRIFKPIKTEKTEAGRINFIGLDLATILGSILNPSEYDEQLSSNDKEEIKNLRIFVDSAVATILNHDIDQIWLSTYISNLWPSMLAAQIIKEKTRIPVVFGGPGVMPLEVREFLLENRIADYCIVGEGEVVAKEFLHACLDQDGISDIPGVSFMDQGHSVHCERRALLSMDELPLPNFDGFPFPGMDIKHYLRRRFEGLPISFSRGCINHCHFCSEGPIWGSFRHLPVQQVIKNLEFYISRHKIRAFYICDSLVNFNPQWLEDLCDQIINRGIDIIFTFCFLQGRNLPPNVIDKMVKAGFSRVSIGIEHGSQRMLDLMNKKTNLDEIREIIIDCVQGGLSVDLSTMVNFPGETLNDIINEIRFLWEIDDKFLKCGFESEILPRRSMGNNFRLEPASEMYKNPDQFGITIIPCKNTFANKNKSAAQFYKVAAIPGSDDSAFHKYLTSCYGEQAPWHMRQQQTKRYAAHVAELINLGQDTFSLADHIVLYKDIIKNVFLLRNYNEVYHLDREQLFILRCILRKMTISQCVQSREKYTCVDLNYIKTFIGLLYVKGVLYFDHVS